MRVELAPIHIDRAVVERVKSFMFLIVHIDIMVHTVVKRA